VASAANRIDLPMPTTTPADWRDPQPLAQAIGLPGDVYTDPDILRIERDAVLARSWQYVAHASQVPASGDYRVVDIAGRPMLLLRDAAGELRALSNICRHRGGPLAIADGSGLKQLRCRYHGWTYDLGGCLKSGPELDSIEGLALSEVRLPAAQVAQWHGLVFVALDPATPPFADFIDGVDAHLAGHDLDSYLLHECVDYDVHCNWKVYVENFLEGYHVPHVHPALNALIDYRRYVTGCGRWHSLQRSPLENSVSFYGEGDVIYFYLWPNTMLDVLPGGLQINRVRPNGVDRCRIESEHYFAPGTAERDATRIAQDRALTEVTQQEDFDVCVRLQRAFASGGYVPGRIHPVRENCLHHWQELYRRAMREAG
jgi:choline monooxygenase